MRERCTIPKKVLEIDHSIPNRLSTRLDELLFIKGDFTAGDKDTM